MSDIDVVLERLVSDDAFRRAFAAEPARELDRYDLTAQQREMLLVQVSPDATIGSGVERRTSKAGMFALLGEAAQLLGPSNVAVEQLTPVPPPGAPDYALEPAGGDGDGLGVAQEATMSTNWAAWDADKDGLPNAEEYSHQTDPLKWDTDGDGLSDGQEIAYHTDPTEADTNHNGPSDYEEAQHWDHDLDQLTDLTELQQGTDPFKYDSDGDGLSDWAEGQEHTDPLDPDSDNDLLTDGDEVHGDGDGWGHNTSNPNDPDTDHDGLIDGLEKAFGTDSKDHDTDHDLASDGYEVEHGTDPNDPGTAMAAAGALDGSPYHAMSPAAHTGAAGGDQTLIAFEHGTQNQPVEVGDVYEDKSELKAAPAGQRSTSAYGAPDTKPVESGYGVPDTHPVDDEQRVGAAPEPQFPVR